MESRAAVREERATASGTRSAPPYVVVSPVRDEEQTLEKTLQSMISQRCRPLRWVIVNDGSTDRTREIVERYLPEHPWIELLNREDRGHRELGPGVIHAFNAGLERVKDLDWQYVVKLDADLSFSPDYFQNLLGRFEANPKLGMASGKTFLLAQGAKKLEWCHDDHVRGPAKMYSRPCFEAIGGIRAMRGWDLVDEIEAQRKGFETKSFIEEELIHHRPIDARQPHVLRSRYEMGRLYHHLGYHWLYLTVRAVRSAFQDYPLLAGGAALLAGFVRAALAGAERYDPDFADFVAKKQLGRFRWSHLRYYLSSTFPDRHRRRR